MSKIVVLFINFTIQYIMIYLEAFVGIAIGMAVFMYGMNIMSSGLTKVAGNKMNTLVRELTKNRVAGAASGMTATAVVHSSTAVTVMVVGLVDAGLLNLVQASGVIIGANVGTTITGLLVALNFLDISLFLMLPVVVGVVFILVNNIKLNRIGGILAGLGLIFVGLDILNEAVAEISQTTFFIAVLQGTGNPILLMLMGALVTAILQSSTAVNSLVIVLLSPTGLNITDAVYIILGTNVGTCVTSMVASAGTSVNARRAALIHLLFNILGTVLFGAVFMSLGRVRVTALMGALSDNVKFQLAWFNLLQNVLTALIALPLVGGLVGISERLIRERVDESKLATRGKVILG